MSCKFSGANMFNILRDIVDWLILIVGNIFVISLTLIGITMVVELSCIASQRTVRGNEDGLPLSIEMLEARCILVAMQRPFCQLFPPTFRICLRT